jgi:D-glycerate 3-kinase
LPAGRHGLSAAELAARAARCRAAFAAACRELQLEGDATQLTRLYLPLAACLLSRAQGVPRVVGVNGAQGAGKSTVCRLLECVVEHGFGRRAATLSIDDLYLTRSERRRLAAEVHPLLATRGVPGTHDVALGRKLLAGLRQHTAGQIVALPQFDKANDERRPREAWREVETPLDLVLFEGWCVGAVAQPPTALDTPLNALERDEDADGRWRSYVNACLAGDYQALFGEIDLLVMLKVPAFERVTEWRGLQERKLAAQYGGKGVMDEAALQRFIMHYERLTRWQLEEMPQRAELVLELGADHAVKRASFNARR